MARPSGRRPEQLRPVKIQREFTKHAEGSVLVSFGDTRVICTASVEPGVPRFLRGKNQGWVTAEYGMLPRSTNERMGREAARGGQGGRTQEIERLIGRSLRAAIDMKKLGENTITIDCDVIQADGGTRTAAITGSYVALAIALEKMVKEKRAAPNALKTAVAAVSVGIVNGQELLDLNYVEDSRAEVDFNMVMTAEGKFVEVQGTAEGEPFARDAMDRLIELGRGGIQELFKLQKQIIAK